jgi:bile acid acyltransferase/acyl-CoA thioester hydrolase-like protein
MAECAIDRLRHRGFRFDVEHAKYEDAGHAILMPPGLPGAAANPWPASSYHQPRWSAGQPFPTMGGTADGNWRARQDAWPRTVQFLRERL